MDQKDAERLAGIRDETVMTGGKIEFLLRLLDAATCRAEALEAEVGRLNQLLLTAPGDEEPCVVCSKPCNSFAGNPGLWPVRLDNTGWRHIGCVNDLLREREALESQVAAAERSLSLYAKDKEALEAEVGRLRQTVGELVALPDDDTGNLWRHKKRGTTYRILGIGRIQCPPGEPLEDDEMPLVYQDIESGALGIRRSPEFHDGRFERMPGRISPPTADHTERARELLRGLKSSCDFGNSAVERVSAALAAADHTEQSDVQRSERTTLDARASNRDDGSPASAPATAVKCAGSSVADHTERVRETARELINRTGHNQPKNYDAIRIATEVIAAALAVAERAGAEKMRDTVLAYGDEECFPLEDMAAIRALPLPGDE